MPEPGADLAVQVADPREILLAAVEVQALLPDLGRLVHSPQPQRDVAQLLRDPRARAGIELAAKRQRGLVVAERLLVRVQRGSRVAGGLERRERLVVDPLELGRLDVGVGPEGGGATVVVRDHRHDALGAVGGALLDEGRRPGRAFVHAPTSAGSSRRRRGSARA